MISLEFLATWISHVDFSLLFNPLHLRRNTEFNPKSKQTPFSVSRRVPPRLWIQATKRWDKLSGKIIRGVSLVGSGQLMMILPFDAVLSWDLKPHRYSKGTLVFTRDFKGSHAHKFSIIDYRCSLQIWDRIWVGVGVILFYKSEYNLWHFFLHYLHWFNVVFLFLFLKVTKIYF